jgi:hypothetical protein
MKTNQAETAVEHFHDPTTQRTLRKHGEFVFAILTEVAPDAMTLKEIARRFQDLTGNAIPDSSLCAPLAMLKGRGQVTDHARKRPCRVNGIRKKVWAVATAEVKYATDAFVAEPALSK